MPALDQPILFVFPGQGSQYRGMGADLCAKFPVAESLYRMAGDILDYDLAALSFEDPQDQLNLTRFTQPALLTHSIACLEVFRDLTDDRLQPAMAAGHSLGEYSALVASQALSFEDALLLVKQRGELMGTYGQGEMSAFPLDLATVQPVAERYHCAIAGINLPEQTVIGGHADDLSLVEQEVQERFPRKRPVRLKTEGAFHTYYMVEAARHFRTVLDRAVFAQTEVRVLSNFTGAFHETDSADLRARLFFQLFHPVRWYSNLQTAFAGGAATIIEFGGGIGSGDTPDSKRPNLEGMIKKALRGCGHEAQYVPAINATSVSAAAELAAGQS